MRYLVIGAGGTGALIGAYLARQQTDVTLVARGEHLTAIRAEGITLHTNWDNSVSKIAIRALAEEDIEREQFDFIFVCVKAYSLKSIAPLIARVSHSRTYVIPVLNSMKAGGVLRRMLPELNITDGCIYITGYISAPGEITQNARVFRLIYGFEGVDQSAFPAFSQLECDLRTAGIYCGYRSSIQAEIFKKMSFTSAFSAAAIYHRCKAGGIQQEGEARQSYLALLGELANIGHTAGFIEGDDLVKSNIDILSNLPPFFSSSLQKDIAAGKPDEREQLIFEIIELAGTYGVDCPHYLHIAQSLGYADLNSNLT